MKRKPFLPLTAVQEIATPANKFTVVSTVHSNVQVNGASDLAYKLKNPAGAISELPADEVELATA